MKSMYISVVALFMLASCQPEKTNREDISTGNTDNEKLIRQYFEHFNKHDWTQMAAMYSDTAEFKDPSLGQGIVKQSREEIAKKYNELQQMIPDVRDSIVTLYPSGDQHLIVEFISKGTAPDNSKFEMPICTIFKIVNGRIVQDFTYYDNF